MCITNSNIETGVFQPVFKLPVKCFIFTFQAYNYQNINLIKFRKMVTINGKSFKGNNVSIINNEVIIDGKKVNSDDNSKTINISVTANIESLEVDYCDKIEVVGECKNVSSKNGDIAIQGNVSGDVTNKNGNIICRNVGGDASTKNGDVVHS